MLAPWAVEEMQSADLEDRRLNRRLTAVLSALAAQPTASIPAACGGYAETLAAYRLFENAKVAYEKVLAPHAARTRERIAAQPVVLLVQDTTELDLTRPQQQVAGAGPLDGSARRGAFWHPLVAFTPDGTPLGTCWSKLWSRPEPTAGASPPSQRKQRKPHAKRPARPLEEKESYRWLEGLRAAREVAQHAPQTQCVCLADSEADVYELFAEPRGAQAVQWLIRAGQERAIRPDAQQADDGLRRCRAAVEAQPVLFTHVISVRGRPQAKVPCSKRKRNQPRTSRRAEVAVRATTVTLRPPYRADEKLPPVTVNVVQVREVAPPPGEAAVEWLLWTTLPIATPEQVRQVVQYYATRFLIEVLFRVLKSGCRVEARRFEFLDRLLPCLAVYLIVAWRTLWLSRLGRSQPDLDCQAVFEPAEWQSVWMAVRREPPPAQPPRLAEFLRLVAQLGGYVNAPGRPDPPGPQTLWLGLQRMHDLALAWNLFGPGATPGPPP